MNAKQDEIVDDLLRSGYHKGVQHDGFVCLFKRNCSPDKNFVCPEYYDVTVFPNGRIAYGSYRKWGRIRRINAEKAKLGVK